MVVRLKERLSSLRRAAGVEDPFDPEFFSRLDRMRIRFGRAHGARSGNTLVRGRTQESGIEIESFKSYSAGDDIRYVDWNAVARLDQLLTRRFVAEREIPVHLLLDTSASMAAPADDRKFSFAVRLTAALAYLALNNNEPVRVATLRADDTIEESPLLRHHGRYPILKSFFAGLSANGPTGLEEGVRCYLDRHVGGGMAFVLSDFLVEDPVYERTIEMLRARKLDVWAIQLVARSEREIDGMRGRLRLRDVETGGVREVSVTDADRRRYRRDFEERVARLRLFCHQRGAGHVVARTELGVGENLVNVFAVEGMLRLR